MFYVFKSFNHPLAKIRRHFWYMGVKSSALLFIPLGYYLHPIIAYAIW